MWLAAVAAGLGGGALLGIGFELVPGAGPPIAAAVVLHVAWVVVPVMASAMDATLDPRSFEELPLSSGELGRGLLAASATGPGGLATMLFVAVGFGVGLWPGPVGIVTVPVLTALMVLIAVVSGRLVTALVSDLLARSRVGEIGSLVAGLVSGLSVLVAMSTLPESIESFELTMPEWVRWLAVLPSGAVGAAFGRFHAGSWPSAGVMTVWASVGLATLVWAHSRALDRLPTRSVTQRSSRVRPDTDVLGAGLQRLVPSPPVRVAAAKELRYLRRDPRVRAQLLGSFVTVMVFGFLATSLFDTPLVSFLAVLATWAVIAAAVPNQFGVDGGSFWTYVASPTDLAVVLAGKNAAWALVAAPVAVVVGAVGSLVGGSLAHLSTALVVSVIVFFVWTAVGNFTSVYGAFPLPERQLFGTNTGGSGRAVVVSLVGLAASGVLTGPPVAAVVVAISLGGPGAGLAAALGGLVYAGAIYAIGWRLVKVIAGERRLALVEVLDAS